MVNNILNNVAYVIKTEYEGYISLNEKEWPLISNSFFDADFYMSKEEALIKAQLYKIDLNSKGWDLIEVTIIERKLDYESDY